jgi:hypothetical protein
MSTDVALEALEQAIRLGRGTQNSKLKTALGTVPDHRFAHEL